MPEEHRKYLEWNGDRYREWARQIGENTFMAINAILTSKRVEQQAYRSCMGLLKMADKYSRQRLEDACKKALSLTARPSWKSIKNIIATDSKRSVKAIEDTPSSENHHGIVRGAVYYGGMTND